MPLEESLISVVEIVRSVDWWTDAALHKLTIKKKGKSVQPFIQNVPNFSFNFNYQGYKSHSIIKFIKMLNINV